jgi:hypothetical protein
VSKKIPAGFCVKSGAGGLGSGLDVWFIRIWLETPFFVVVSVNDIPDDLRDFPSGVEGLHADLFDLIGSQVVGLSAEEVRFF